MKRKTKILLLIHALVIFLILCIAFLPVASVVIAGVIADANGCQVDEGSVHPCIVNGRDMGETLYAMGMMGWFMIATIPIGLGVAVLYLIIVVGFTIVRRVVRQRG